MPYDCDDPSSHLLSTKINVEEFDIGLGPYGHTYQWKGNLAYGC